MKKIKNIDETSLLFDYNNGEGLMNICKKYKIGKLKAKEIITKNGGVIRPKSSFKKNKNFVVSDWRIKKYINTDEYYYVAICKDDGVTFNDIENKGGHLTSYIEKKYNIKTPTLYDRRLYYQKTGNYWWEQWFKVEKRAKKKTKKCPYCDWETIDINNNSGAFETHLKNVHKKTIEEHLVEHGEDSVYFKKYIEKKIHSEKLGDFNNYVICPICGNKYEKLTESHIKTHGISFDEFKEKYPYANILSNTMKQQTLDAVKLGNLSVSKKRFISKYEKEIQEFLSNNGIDFETNRQILIGQEIDILIPSLKIGIEFDGLKWHTEWFGRKKHNYHLEKTIKCNERGYDLIHIFEDEYVNKKDIVYAKLMHILHISNDLPRIYARKCVVKQIYKAEAKEFLEKYHIQGFVSSSVYLGCFNGNELIGVMSFKNGNLKNDSWELTRFASNYNYICCGVGGKMFKYFLSNYKPDCVISFADRRWTTKPYDNLYTKLGFSFERFNSPDYKYYCDNSKNKQKYQRIHKMKLNKVKLHKKYGFPLTMTETEMAKELGYDRIWDCGLIKYVWKNNNVNNEHDE